MYIAWFLSSILVIFLSGSAVLRFIDKDNLYNSAIERVAISYGLGVLAVSLVQLYAIFIKIPLNKVSTLLLLGPFIFFELYYLAKKCLFKKIIRWNGFKIFLAERIRLLKTIGVLEWLLLIFMILLCIIMLLVCLLMPMYTYDSRATWGLKAKMLFHKQTIFTDDFLDPYRFHSNTPYPILIPLAENFFYNMLGQVDDYSVKIIFALFYIISLFFIYITQKRYFSASRIHALIFTSIFASVPCLFVIFNGSVPSAYADFPLACFFTLTVVYLFNYIRSGNLKHIIIASLFSCGCLFTKNEGFPLFLISIFIFIIDGFIGKYFINKSNVKALLIYVFLPVLILLPWFLIRSKLPTTFDNNPLPFLTLDNLAIGFSRLGTIARYTIWNMFFNFRSWGIIWMIVVMAVIINYRESKRIYSPRLEWYLLVIPIVYYIFVITPIYMMYTSNFSSLEINFGPDGASFERLRLHVFPLLILFVSLRINRLFGQRINNV